jgi:DDE superfamily endonuclease
VEEAQEQLLMTVRRDPMTLGYEQSRWQLSMLMQACSFIKVKTAQGLWLVMRRLKVHYKASRQYVHSPDVDYETKWSYIQQTCEMSIEEDVVVLFLDELSYYNQPTTADAYAEKGHDQALARRAHGAEKTSRIIGTLEAKTGKVCFFQRSKITIACLISFLQYLAKTYENKRIFIIIDNWPVHYHPDVLAALQEQMYKQYFRTPDSWKDIKPKKKYLNLNLPIQFVPLPTYASWLNPIEKLWRWLKKDILHNHQMANDWTLLKEKVCQFLSQFNEHSEDLLKYGGLKNPLTKYGKILSYNGLYLI